MDMEEFLNYHVWADKLLINSLSKVSEMDFIKEHENIRSLKELLIHYISNYDALSVSYTERMKKEEMMLDLQSDKLLDELSLSRDKFIQFAKQLKSTVPLELTDDITHDMDKDNYLMIFLDHMTYHRGQITHSIKLLGYSGVNTDYYDFQEHLAGLK
jgi:uncharacterized damage-inducible protein DinB